MKELILGSEGMGIWGSSVIRKLITILYPNIKITNKNNNNCNIIIKSHFKNDENDWNNIKKKYIYWSGESFPPEKSDFETNYLYVLTTFINNNNLLYIPYVLYSPFLYKERINNNINRKYLIAYCSSNKVEIRENLFNIFVEKVGIELCHSLGDNYGNYPLSQNKINGGWDSLELINKYTEYKFVFALENTKVLGYTTEKILNAFYSGAIPIYYGNENVNDLFNKEAFINVSDFESLEKCVDYVLNITDNEREYIMKQPIYNSKSDIINLLNNEYNLKNDNKILKKYLAKLKEFIEES
jgi:hypothetical protein